MRLNPDCIRDILLACEEICTATNWAIFNKRENFSIDGKRYYEYDELIYHLNQCDLNGYFTESKYSILGEYQVKDITPKAHEFLANIREDTNWNKIKDIALKIGSVSLSSLNDIAAKVIAEIIKSQMGI